MLKIHHFAFAIVPLSVSLHVQAELKQNDTLLVTDSSKQSRYAASSQNVASYRLDSYQLEAANVTNTKNLNTVLPGFNYGDSDSSMNPVTSIRGFTSIGNWYNPSVTLYVDGVPQLPVGFSQPLGDISSVEVLKGSQGTLYGASAQGGIINIITEQPGHEYKGYLSAGYASRNGYRGKFTVSGPLVDNLLYAGLSGSREVTKGRIVNPITGSKNLGGEANNLGTFKLRLAPDNQPWEMGASYNSQCMDSTAGIMIDPTDVHNLTGTNTTPGTLDPDIHRCIQNQQITGKYITDHWQLSLISSWQQVKVAKRIPGYTVNQNISFPERWLEDVQELRILTRGKDNIIDGVFGIYRQNVRAWVGTTKFSADKTPVAGKPAAYDDYTRVANQSIAAYTDLTWHATNKLDFGAGLRFSHDSGKTYYMADPKFTSGEQVYVSGTVSKNNVLGQLSAGYQLTEANRVYARIAQGYKPTGFDYRPRGAVGKLLQPEPFRPEHSITYEIGNKYQSETVNLQGAVFYNRVSNTQMYISQGEGTELQRILLNAGDSSAIGVELNGDYVFVPGWRVGANVNVIHDKFGNDSRNNTADGNYINKPVPYVPNFTAGIWLQGNINTGIGTITPYIGVNYTSSYSFDSNDSFRQSGYSLTSINVAWQATDRITLSAYVNNLFDQRYLTYASYKPNRHGHGYAYTNFGRTAGVDLKIALF